MLTTVAQVITLKFGVFTASQSHMGLSDSKTIWCDGGLYFGTS